jgi:hypothetical protein
MHTQQQGFQFTSAWRMGLLGLIMSQVLLVWGCAEHHEMGHHVHPAQGDAKEVRSDPARTGLISMGLDPAAQEAHKTVMRAHFEGVHKIVAALAEEDFVKAREITEYELGFAKHREAMRLQKPEHFPADYHDLAMAHHEAAEDLAKSMSSKDLKLVLPQLEQTLYACVACHRVYKQ